MSNDRSQPKADMANETLGGLRTFAAHANETGQFEESGRSGLRPSFFDVQSRRKSAKSPDLPMLHYV
jgi:hypothetical protein